jgi:hypothetical protein
MAKPPEARRHPALLARPSWNHDVAYYADPDGNRMELQVDCGTVQEAIAWMKSPAFAANPKGVLYDPDALLARLEAGEDSDSLPAVPAGVPSPIPAAHRLT